MQTGAQRSVRPRHFVLVVDDHLVNRLILVEQVAALGYAVEAASDGVEAMEKWRCGRYRLVITDCNMPGMDGYALTAAIREAERASGRPRTAIIACAGGDHPDAAVKCLAAGMDDYLAKPVAPGMLSARLEAWVPIPDRALPVDLASGAMAALRDGVRRLAGEKFREANDPDVTELLAAIDARDSALLRGLAHRIKGASRALGARPLAEVCQRMEVAAQSRDWTAIIANRDGFLREVRRLNAFLAASAG